MKLQWKYKYFDSETGRIQKGKEHKIVEVWSETQPDEDYEMVMTPSSFISKNKEDYNEREKQGVDYSRYMDARLLFLKTQIPNEQLSKTLRGMLDDMFNKTRIEVHGGRWYSAEREAEKIQFNLTLDSIINQYELQPLINQQGLIDEVKLRIQKAITELY